MSTEQFNGDAEEIAIQVLRMGLKGYYAREVWLERMERKGWWVSGGKVVISGKPNSPSVFAEGCKIKWIGKNW